MNENKLGVLGRLYRTLFFLSLSLAAIGSIYCAYVLVIYAHDSLVLKSASAKFTWKDRATEVESKDKPWEKYDQTIINNRAEHEHRR